MLITASVTFIITCLVNSSFWPSLGVSTSPMLVHLAGVELTPEGREWLQKSLPPAQTVWLKLISRENSTLHCLLSQNRVRDLIMRRMEPICHNCLLNVRLMGVFIRLSNFLAFLRVSRRGRCGATVWTKRSSGWVWLALRLLSEYCLTLVSTGVSTSGCTGQRSELRGKGGDSGSRTAYWREPPRLSGTVLYSDWWRGSLRGADALSDWLFRDRALKWPKRDSTHSVLFILPADVLMHLKRSLKG